MEFDYEALPIGSIAISQKGSRYVKSKSGWHPEGKFRFYNRGKTPPSYPYDPIVRVDPVMNSDTAKRLMKLHTSEPYIPKWNQQKFFLAMEAIGWVIGIFVSRQVKGTSVTIHRGFLLTEAGDRLLAEHNAAQPSDVEETQ